MVFVDQANKIRMLTHWLQNTDWTRTLVFTRTKHRADKVAKLLKKSGIEADAFHADKSQSARQRTLARFKSPDPVVLIATDIAARGLDIDMVSHVINFDLPVDAENYVHRIGRTGRAGADGVALSFCDVSEREVLHAIQKLDEADAGRGGRAEGVAPRPARQRQNRPPQSPKQRPVQDFLPTPESRSGRASSVDHGNVALVAPGAGVSPA